MSVTIGTSLHAVTGTRLGKKLSEAIRALQKHLGTYHSKETKPQDLAPKLFWQAGIPTANEATESPGSDLCFIIDTSNNDLYFVHTWVSATSFSVVKVVD